MKLKIKFKQNSSTKIEKKFKQENLNEIETKIETKLKIKFINQN
jgi:hypothetical protein